ncbi:hypothetical protein LSAT2_002607, partial [Lamellibrachia satsuma]
PPKEPSHSVVPAGLTRERQLYLFTKIREFCSKEKQDVTCRRPAEQATDLTELEVDDDEPASVDTPAQNQEQVPPGPQNKRCPKSKK